MVLRRRASRARAPLLPWVPETFLARLPCNMLKGDSKKDGKKSIRLISKNKTTLRHGAHSFVHFFAIVLHDYNVTLPVTCFMEEMSYVLMPVFFFSLPLILLLLPQTQVQAFRL